MSRYVCIHGHFYQPPRENPWLDVVEQQDSAHPYHDWNHRITAECYAPNATARILDGDGKIAGVASNYARISFNVGPTLLSWMETEEPETYRAILAADKASAKRFGGHGSAIAQVYNHLIMPLASARDKATQVRWGIRDFEHRYGRRPKGMWLAETAVDTATLEALAEGGIEYTILAPRQCARVRPFGGEWSAVGGGVNPRVPYSVKLPSGKQIAVFFYDGPISQGIAFENLLVRGEALADRLTSAFEDGDDPQLVHVATDGETYGHHHKYGEMALAYALPHIERTGRAQVTNYGQFLELHPPRHEAEIVEDSSWSCAHGIERWRSDCGCRADSSRGWTQAWRRPLRESLDWLARELGEVFERELPLASPWVARDKYIEVILDRGDESLDAFFEGSGGGQLSSSERQSALTLLEMQRHAMLMYTSCGWFFDELSGIETVQIIRYAARAIQLAAPVAPHLEQEFCARLAHAKSNLGGGDRSGSEPGGCPRDGAELYARAVKPSIVELPGLVAHFAVSSIFEGQPQTSTIYAHDFEVLDQNLSRSAGRKLTVGKVRCASRITREEATLSYAVLHLGQQSLTAGVRAFQGDDEYLAMRADVSSAFERDDVPELMRLLDDYFLDMTYSLRSLLGDSQRRIASTLLKSALDSVTEVSLRLHREHAGVIRYVASLGIPLPQMVGSTAAFVLNGALRRAIDNDIPDVVRIAELVREAKGLGAPLDDRDLAAALEKTLFRLAERFAAVPGELERLNVFASAVSVIEAVPFETPLYRIQNAVFRVAKGARREKLASGDRVWLDRFAELAETLNVRIE